MKEWLQKLTDPSRDVYERRYRLMSLISIVAMMIWLLVALLMDGYAPRILFFGVCDLLFIPVMMITLKTGKIQLGAGSSALVLVFLMLPVAFFNNGGIYAGAPNWSIISMVFVTMTVRGGFRTFLLLSDIVMTVILYVATWQFPELLEEFTPASAYVDSAASLIITGLLVSSMFLFQLYMAWQEQQRLKMQQEEILSLNRAQNRFFSSMSHEIRTPVNTIVGLNEMILRQDLPPEVLEDASQVRAAGKILLHLVGDILDMSKLESGNMELFLSDYDLGLLLSEVVGMMWIQAHSKGLAFHVDVDPELPSRLNGDEMRIRQILINVLGNAVKYTKEGSVTLTVHGKREDGNFSLLFSVSDTGIGIRKENLPQIFNAFRRVDVEENRNIEGTGLGLSIVRQFVDLMGGSISVNSVYTVGSTFIIELPQTVVSTEGVGRIDVEKHQAQIRPERTSVRLKAPEARVLVVDDDKANRMVVEKLLSDTLMQIDGVSSGREALEKTLRVQYHLIFMDHLMPEMDGISCLTKIREQMGGFSKEAKVVVLTANADNDARALYARAGFDGYLLKPTSGEALEKECMRQLPRELVHFIREDKSIVEESMLWMDEYKKKEAIVITTDSIADLPSALIQEYRIGVIPHNVRTSEGIFQDGVEIESNSLVDYMATHDLVKTLAPEVKAYEQFFAQELSRGSHVLHISISAKIEGSGYQNAAEAAKAFDNVTVFDSEHLSSGEGLLALQAARLSMEGSPLKEILEALDRSKAKIHSSFIVDNLGYMERAGYVSRRAQRFASAMMLRPTISLKRGRFGFGRIFLGSRERTWKKYMNAELGKSRKKQGELFVTYVGLSQGERKLLRQMLEEMDRFEKIYFQKASPAIAVNCGPGTFGLLYEEKSLA